MYLGAGDQIKNAEIKNGQFPLSFLEGVFAFPDDVLRSALFIVRTKHIKARIAIIEARPSQT